MRRYSLRFAMFAAGTLALLRTASAAPKHLLLVVSKGLPGITLYDADTEKRICQAHLGVSPHEAAFSLDGKFAYVPVYGSSGVGKPGTDGHTLHFIRTADCTEAGVLDTGENKRPHGIAVGASGAIYLTTEISQSVLVIDPLSRTIKAKIPTNSSTSHMIGLAKDEKTIYVSNVQSKTVSVLNVSGAKLAREIPTGVENQRMTISPNGMWFVTSLGPEHKIAFYRTSDLQLDFAIQVEGTPFVAAFSADGKYLFEGGHEKGKIRIWKVDVGAKAVVATISEGLGNNVGSLVVSPFNQQVYVSDQATNIISEIDPVSWTVKKTLTTDKTPDQMIFANAGK